MSKVYIQAWSRTYTHPPRCPRSTECEGVCVCAICGVCQSSGPEIGTGIRDWHIWPGPDLSLLLPSSPLTLIQPWIWIFSATQLPSTPPPRPSSPPPSLRYVIRTDEGSNPDDLSGVLAHPGLWPPLGFNLICQDLGIRMIWKPSYAKSKFRLEKQIEFWMKLRDIHYRNLSRLWVN